MCEEVCWEVGWVTSDVVLVVECRSYSNGRPVRGQKHHLPAPLNASSCYFQEFLIDDEHDERTVCVGVRREVKWEVDSGGASQGQE